MLEKLNKNIQEILKGVGHVADALGYECYVVGGFVRDLIMNVPNDDIDFVVVGNGLNMANAVAKYFKTNKVSLYESYGTAKVDIDGFEIEFVGARKEFYHRESRNPIIENGTLEDDMARRDLTINDIAICVNGNRFGELIDPHGGVSDIKNAIIKTPLDPNITFSDDPLRMLRAIRFATRFSFEFDAATWQGIVDNSERIKIITKERIAEEVCKMMRGKDPTSAFRYLDESGLLKIILPTVYDMHCRKDDVYKRKHKDIFDHSLKVLQEVCKHTDNEWVRWAALLHDVGKVRVRKFENGNWTFMNHAEVGSKMIRAIFTKFGLPLDNRMELVEKLVRLHMRPMQLCESSVTDSAIRRILFESGEDIDSLMILCNADMTTENLNKKDVFRKNYELLVKRIVELEESDHLRNFQPPVNGNEIMEMFNLTPCKTVGILKDAVKDAILEGTIKNDYKEAKQFVVNLYNKLNGKV